MDERRGIERDGRKEKRETKDEEGVFTFDRSLAM